MLRKPSAHFGQNDCWNLEHRLLALQRHPRVRTKTTCIFMTTWGIVLRDYTSKLYLLGIRYCPHGVCFHSNCHFTIFQPEVRSQLRGFRSVSRYWHHANHNMRSRAISHPPQSECTPWVVETGGGAHIVPFACKSLTLLLSTIIHSFSYPQPSTADSTFETERPWRYGRSQLLVEHPTIMRGRSQPLASAWRKS
ncbi:hypothetical protein K443DRAFT_660184 [Laccaria amethystina LaAM-08-1]|uniref:Uncharacterized protein n=1 Tax=Laccaria amethystina LaAM-08-1 TaxID=1095629 RepID=A0A0C9WSH4_9AGAR|nr:hypothetical protein K443DRAFT_660184 [Laccaria amethystina LaAM-08-1]